MGQCKELTGESPPKIDIQNYDGDLKGASKEVSADVRLVETKRGRWGTGRASAWILLAWGNLKDDRYPAVPGSRISSRSGIQSCQRRSS